MSFHLFIDFSIHSVFLNDHAQHQFYLCKKKDGQIQVDMNFEILRNFQVQDKYCYLRMYHSIPQPVNLPWNQIYFSYSAYL